MSISSGWQLAAEIGGGLLGTMLGGNLMGSSAASQQDRQFSHNWGLMDHQAAINSAAMQQQNNYNVLNYAQRYQLAKSDLKAAGLNPILAATQGIGGNIQGASALGSGLNSVGQSSVPDYVSGLSSAFQGALGRKAAIIQFEKNLELQERSVAVQEMEAQTHRMDVENQSAVRVGHLELDKVAQTFDMQLRQAWQTFEIDRKTQETGAYIRHLAAQDANLVTMAQVALRDVAVKEMLADIAAKNGIALRDLQVAEAVMKGEQSKFLSEQGNSERVKQELMRAETALANYRRSVAPVETLSDVMKGVLSVAIATKVGLDLIPSGSGRIGF